eukprot:g3284.t1
MISADRAARLGESSNNRSFLLESLRKKREEDEEDDDAAALRMDGRAQFDIRALRVTFGRSHARSFAEVQLGETRCRTVVTAQVVPPYEDRPVEGFLTFHVDFSSAGSTADFDGDSGLEELTCTEICSVIERGIRDARAIDTEALCIIAGEKAWALHCEIQALDNGGNVLDAASLATIAALRHFRRPVVSVVDGAVREHLAEERVPEPLAIHHTPVALTFAFFRNGADCVSDPSFAEELSMDGTLTLIFNEHGEVCGVSMSGGAAVSREVVTHCSQIAREKARTLCNLLDGELVRADKAAMAAYSSTAARPGSLTLGASELSRVSLADIGAEEAARIVAERSLVATDLDTAPLVPLPPPPPPPPVGKSPLLPGGIQSDGDPIAVSWVAKSQSAARFPAPHATIEDGDNDDDDSDDDDDDDDSSKNGRSVVSRPSLATDVGSLELKDAIRAEKVSARLSEERRDKKKRNKTKKKKSKKDKKDTKDKRKR